jgi:membrane protease YdiL (CAAX protease family)
MVLHHPDRRRDRLRPSEPLVAAYAPSTWHGRCPSSGRFARRDAPEANLNGRPERLSDVTAPAIEQSPEASGTKHQHMALGAFFMLVLVLSIPFWVAGALTDWQMLPGLPVSALGFACPAMAATILVYRDSSSTGVTALLTRSFDWNRIDVKAWYVPIILVKPALDVLTYGLIRATGLPLPAPRFSLPAAVAMFVAFFVAALGEELGWSGYAIDPMQARWNALEASILLGLVWAALHWVPLIEAHRPLTWIAWWSLGTVASRVLIVWLYNNTGKSVFATALFHACGNVSWQLFPIDGSHWDPRINGVVTAFAVVIVTVVWGSRTLSARRGRE